MRYFKQKHQEGFTLVETLVAITILLLVITGPMTISMSTARSTTYASEQVIAFFLAQEGAELVQMARDQLLLDAKHDGSPADPWGDFADHAGTGSSLTTCYGATGCGLELNTDVDATLVTPVKDCSNAGACKLYYDTSPHLRNRYTHSAVTGGITNETTSFTRTVYLTKVSNFDVRVVSRVTWRTGGLRSSQVVEVETHLFDTYEP